MPQVRVRLNKDGSIKATVEGAVGPGCTELTAFLNKLFGDPESVELKSEYYEETVLETDRLPSGHCG